MWIFKRVVYTASVSDK